MPTLTLYVGNPWSADKDTLAKLYRMLDTETLDPLFEAYGNFCTPAERAIVRHYNEDPRSGELGQLSEVGSVHFWGNFFSYSCSFSVYTDDPEVIETLKAKVLANKATVAYKEARAVRREEKRQKLAREREIAERHERDREMRARYR